MVPFPFFLFLPSVCGFPAQQARQQNPARPTPTAQEVVLSFVVAFPNLNEKKGGRKNKSKPRTPGFPNTSVNFLTAISHISNGHFAVLIIFLCSSIATIFATCKQAPFSRLFFFCHGAQSTTCNFPPGFISIKSRYGLENLLSRCEILGRAMTNGGKRHKNSCCWFQQYLDLRCHKTEGFAKTYVSSTLSISPPRKKQLLRKKSVLLFSFFGTRHPDCRAILLHLFSSPPPFPPIKKFRNHRLLLLLLRFQGNEVFQAVLLLLLAYLFYTSGPSVMI